MRVGKLLPAALLALFVNLPCAAWADITVGVLLSLTGPNSALGIPYKKGLELLPKEIGGHKFNVIVLDDASDPSNAVRNAQKLITENNVDVIFGPTTSPAGYAVREMANKANVLQFVLAPVDAKGADADWLVTMPQPADVWIIPIAKDMKARGVKRVAHIGFSDAWGDIVFNGVKGAKELGGYEIVADERYARADTSVSGQVLKLLAAKPDAIVMGGSGTPGVLPHIALAERNFTGLQYENPGVFSPDFLRLAGKSVEGVMGVTGPIYAASQLPESNPIRQVSLDFIEKLKAVNDGNPPNSFHAYSYDSLLIFQDITKRAVAKAKPGTPEFRTALRDELYNVKELIGTQGIYNFKKGNPYGHDERAIILMHIKDGRWVLGPK